MPRKKKPAEPATPKLLMQVAVRSLEDLKKLTDEELANVSPETLKWIFSVWQRRPMEFSTARAVRIHLQDTAFWHKCQIVDNKFVTTQAYVSSAILVTLDRERMYEQAPDDDLKTVIEENGGTLNLTLEQMAAIGQTAKDSEKVKLIKQYIRENKGITDVDAEVVPVISKTETSEEQWPFQ